MPQRRPESPSVRSWNRDVPNENELSEIRPWVIWGDATPPDRAATDVQDPPPGEPGSDVAWEIAVDRDPAWGSRVDEDSFVMVLEADEDDVGALVEDDARVRGYAPYLIDARRGPTAR